VCWTSKDELGWNGRVTTTRNKRWWRRSKNTRTGGWRRTKVRWDEGELGKVGKGGKVGEVGEVGEVGAWVVGRTRRRVGVELVVKSPTKNIFRVGFVEVPTLVCPRLGI